MKNKLLEGIPSTEAIMRLGTPPTEEMIEHVRQLFFNNGAEDLWEMVKP